MGAVIVEVDAKQRKWKLRAGLLDGSDHEAAFARPHRHALGPARSDIGQHHRLREAAGRRRTRMGHEIDLDITGQRIVPVPESAHRDRPAYRGTHSGAPTPATARHHTYL